MQRYIRKEAIGYGQPLSSTAKSEIETMRQQRLEAERQADVESLHLLEAATAANSKLAKAKDMESLEVLMRHTAVNEQESSFVLVTPIKKSFWPNFRFFKRSDDTPLSNATPFSTPSSVQKAILTNRGQIKGLNGTPRSYEPSFSTTSGLRNELKLTKSDNEFEDFLSRSRLGGQPGSTSKGKQRRTSFSDRLESVRSTSIPKAQGKAMDSAYIQEQANSVFQYMDRLKKEDEDRARGDEEDGEEDEKGSVNSDSTTTDVSLPDSPTSYIKHQPNAALGDPVSTEREEDADSEAEDSGQDLEQDSEQDSGQEAIVDQEGSEVRQRMPARSKNVMTSDEGDESDWEVVST
jgi:hypothetical protein